MARSIGKVKIKKLRRIVAAQFVENAGAGAPWQDINKVTIESVEAQIPEAWYDIWEGAWSEIQNEISDAIQDARRVARQIPEVK